MAGRPPKTENVEVKSTTQEYDVESLVKLVKSLSEKLETLQNERNQPQVSIVETEKINVKNNQDSLYREVTFKCVYPGLMLNLNTDSHTVESMKYGDDYTCTFKEAREIVRLNKKWFRNGYVVFDDFDVIKELKLSSYYKHVVDTEKMENISKLSVDELKALYNTANDDWKEIIVNKFMCEYLNNNYDFMDAQKIDVLSKLSERNITMIVGQLQSAKL